MARPASSLHMSLHLLVILLSCACVAAGFYAHPAALQLPTFIPSVPEIESALRARLTPPLLFLLLNLLIMALVLMPQGDRSLQENTAAADGCSTAGDCSSPGTSVLEVVVGDGNYSTDCRRTDCMYRRDAAAAAAARNLVHEDDVDVYYDSELQPHQMEGGNSMADSEAAAVAAAGDGDGDAAAADGDGDGDGNDDARKVQKQAHARSRRCPTHRSRNIARSSSDGIILMHGAIGLPQRPPALQPRPLPRFLKKASTFESALRRRRVTPVVVVGNPREEGQTVEEEVDKKAEEFIGRFYQRMKLQL